MSQKRKNIRLPEHCEMLRAIKLYFEENSINLNRYALYLIKYYLITGKFYSAGKINPLQYHERISQAENIALYIDTDDKILKEWMDNLNSREIAKHVRFILNNSFSIADENDITPFDVIYNDCELLMMQHLNNTTPTLSPTNEKLDKLISLLEKIDSDELDKLFDLLKGKVEDTIDHEKNVEEGTTTQETEEAEEDALERTQKMLSSLNSLL